MLTGDSNSRVSYSQSENLRYHFCVCKTGAVRYDDEAAFLHNCKYETFWYGERYLNQLVRYRRSYRQHIVRLAHR
jgi:hypothetical protein